jgi:hypothetical protein
MAEPKGLTERGRKMRRLLAAQKRSGLSLVEFARQRGLRANTLSWWRHRLRDADEDGESVSSGGFIEITPALGVREVQTVGFEIVLGDGTVVRVPEGFSEEPLRRLLAVLRC